MDTLVTVDGRQFLKHYLIDFGSILGSAGYSKKEPWMGHEYAIARPEAAVQMVTFGFYLPMWMRSNYPKLTGAGLFDARSFDPVKWKANYPNPAFLRTDDEDSFWAAKQVAAFTDEEIRAIVETGEYSDPRATDWITDCLIQRRDKIAAAWLGKGLPLDRFRVTDGELSFDDLSKHDLSRHASGMPLGYKIEWATFDNQRGVVMKLPSAAGRKLPAVDTATEYLAATIASGDSTNPITVYLRRAGSSFEVVGSER
jgi:hypothetical protein